MKKSIVVFVLIILMLVSLTSCSIAELAGADPVCGCVEFTGEPTASPLPTPVKNSDGYTSAEAQAVAYAEAKKVFQNPVLWRMRPSNSNGSLESSLSGEWENDDRSKEWAFWYVDPNEENVIRICFDNKNIIINETVPRSIILKDSLNQTVSTGNVDPNWPKEKTPVSMRQAAVKAAEMGADLNAVVWIEYTVDYPLDGFRQHPYWTFFFDLKPKEDDLYSYHLFIDAVTGEAAGAADMVDKVVKLPIDPTEIMKVTLNGHEADLRTFLKDIAMGDPEQAMRQFSPVLAANEFVPTAFLRDYTILKGMEIVAIRPNWLFQWSDKLESYEAIFKMKDIDTLEDFGWHVGENSLNITIVPSESGGLWRIDSIYRN